ncbi:hypothetical protein [Desulfatiglans anilini]|uniref:hypothetical protein n=1 Tax=Desulfatiglans anilini TaxID=90728 RepID=UPI000489BA68|nr:hypothetical protein [Desulfatiglans anilini]
MRSAGLRRASLALQAGRSPGGMPFEFNAVCLIMAAATRGFLVLAALCAALLPHAGTPATYYIA